MLQSSEQQIYYIPAELEKTQSRNFNNSEERNIMPFHGNHTGQWANCRIPGYVSRKSMTFAAHTETQMSTLRDISLIGNELGEGKRYRPSLGPYIFVKCMWRDSQNDPADDDHHHLGCRSKPKDEFCGLQCQCNHPHYNMHHILVENSQVHATCPQSEEKALSQRVLIEHRESQFTFTVFHSS